MGIFTRLSQSLKLGSDKGTKVKLATEHPQPDGSRLITQDGITGGILVDTAGFYTPCPGGDYTAADGSTVSVPATTPEDAFKIAEAARAEGIAVQEKLADDAAKEDEQKMGVKSADGVMYDTPVAGQPLMIINPDGSTVAAPPNQMIPLEDGTIIETDAAGNVVEIETMAAVVEEAKEVIEQQAAALKAAEENKLKLEAEIAKAKATLAALEKHKTEQPPKKTAMPENREIAATLGLMAKLSRFGTIDPSQIEQCQREYYALKRNPKRKELSKVLLSAFNGSPSALKVALMRFYDAQINYDKNVGLDKIHITDPRGAKHGQHFNLSSIDVNSDGYDGQFTFDNWMTDVYADSVLFDENQRLISRFDAFVTSGKIPRMTQQAGDMFSPNVNCELTTNTGVDITFDEARACEWTSNVQYCRDQIIGTPLDYMLQTITNNFREGLIPMTILDVIAWLKTAILHENRDNWFFYGNPNAPTIVSNGTFEGQCQGFIGYVKASERYNAATQEISIATPTIDTVIDILRNLYLTAAQNAPDTFGKVVDADGTAPFFIVDSATYQALRMAQTTESWRKNFDQNEGDFKGRFLTLWGGVRVIPSQAFKGRNQIMLTYGQTPNSLTFGVRSNMVMLVDETTDTNTFAMQKLPYPNQRTYHSQWFGKMGAYCPEPGAVFFGNY